jgi:CBS-domain-containing membrane protein
MISNKKPLLALTAADLMTREVVAIPAGTTMRAAARVLAHARVNGAPVIDTEGRCVGVLSTSDFFRGAVQENLEIDPTDKVGEHMTADPVTVTPATGIRELARMMLDADIHRVIVVDDQDQPIGVVSSTDVLAAMAYDDSEKKYTRS